MDRALAQIDLADAVDAAIEARSEDAFGLVERLVAERSVLGHEAGAQRVLAAALEPLGFTTEWLDVPAEIAADPAAGIPHPDAGPDPRRVLVARLPGTGTGTSEGAGGRSLVINGHVDVVPEGEASQWTHGAFTPVRAGGWLIGRGSSDMKGGWGMALLALRALRDAGWTPAADLTVVAVIEEECTGNGTLASLRAGIVADAAYLPEPTDLQVLLAGVGVLWLEIVVSGHAAHAEVASAGVSALDGAVAVVEALQRVGERLNEGVDGPPPYHVNVGRVEAGDWPSSVPATARLGVRVGFPPDWSVAEAEERVRAALDEALAGDPRLAGRPLQIRPSGFRAEGYALAETCALTSELAAAHEQAHGAAPALTSTNGTTDARFYLNQGDMPALCFGPRSRNMHGVDEAVELASIVDGARTLARFLPRWLGGTGDRG